MPVPSYGAPPLAKTFVLARGLALVAMVAVVGITAHFVAQIVESNIDPPREVIATLAITCLATLYSLLSLPLFYSPAHTTTLLTMTALDALHTLAFIIISVLVGRPVSFLECPAIRSPFSSDSDSDSAATSTSAYEFVQALQDNLGKDGSRLGLGDWAGSTGARCYETKAVLGLCIGLAVLYAISAVVLPVLWMKGKRTGWMGRKGEV